MLGRTATGLASLLDAELGTKLDKRLQHHDWTERPLLPDQLRYLADDVVHLHALAERLSAEIEARSIADAVEEETRYRLAQAIAASGTVDPRPPYVRLKGADRAPSDDLPILKRLAALREERARELDVPPYTVLGPDVLFAIARARPRTAEELARVKGATGGARGGPSSRRAGDGRRRASRAPPPGPRRRRAHRPRRRGGAGRAPAPARRPTTCRS